MSDRNLTPWPCGHSAEHAVERVGLAPTCGACAVTEVERLRVAAAATQATLARTREALAGTRDVLQQVGGEDVDSTITRTEAAAMLRAVNVANAALALPQDRTVLDAAIAAAVAERDAHWERVCAEQERGREQSEEARHADWLARVTAEHAVALGEERAKTAAAEAQTKELHDGLLDLWVSAIAATSDAAVIADRSYTTAYVVGAVKQSLAAARRQGASEAAGRCAALARKVYGAASGSSADTTAARMLAAVEAEAARIEAGK